MSVRGITKETRSKGIKQFKPIATKNNGLNLATVKFNLDYKLADEKDKRINFRGLNLPTLVVEFTQFDVAKDEEPAKYFHNFNPVEDSEPKRDAIERGMFSSLKQLIEEVMGRPLTDDDYKLLILDIKDDPTGEEVVAAYDKLFKNIISIVKDANEKQVYWLKLLIYNGDYTVNNGNVGLGLYPGDFIERFVQGKQPNLSINIAKGESIIPRPKQVSTTPVANAAAAPDTNVAAPDWMNQGQVDKDSAVF